MAAAEQTVTLVTSDGDSIVVAAAVARQSLTIAHILDDLGEDADPAVAAPLTVPLPAVKGAESAGVMRRVVDLMELMHADAAAAPAAPAAPAAASAPVGSARPKLADLDIKAMFETLTVANFLNCQPLVDAGIDEVVRRVRGKTPEEIRGLFNIENDFTAEEEAEIRRDSAWAFE
jgi:S-phase kinase-associated protein 1